MRIALNQEHHRVLLKLLSRLGQVEPRDRTFGTIRNDVELVEVGSAIFLVHQVHPSNKKIPMFEIQGNEWVLTFYGKKGFYTWGVIHEDPKKMELVDLRLIGDLRRFENDMLFVKMLGELA